MEGAGAPPPSSVDPRSGFCAATKIFHSLRPPAPLPPPSQPVTVTSYVFSLLPPCSRSPSSPALINATGGGASLSFPELLSRVRALAASLRSRFGLSKGDVAFVLAPAGLEVPVLYYALLAIGAVVSPSNPTSTAQEISHQFQLTSPSVAFATSAVAHKIPRGVETVILDSDQFRALLEHDASDASHSLPAAAIQQSDPATILYSSGTTGRVKAVVLSHRNFIALTSYYKSSHEQERESPSVLLLTVPLFHVFGFTMLLRATAIGETMVLMERFDFAAMLQAVERYRVTFMPVSPPLIVAMLKSDAVGRHDLSSLELVGCGGAPLGREVAERFAARFPHTEISQGYGLTESAGGATATMGPEEHREHGSAGRLACNTEAKIVDPSTGQALPPGQQGELWLRSPYNMIGIALDPVSRFLSTSLTN